jgi:hypothetical protein
LFGFDIDTRMKVIGAQLAKIAGEIQWNF